MSLEEKREKEYALKESKTKTLKDRSALRKTKDYVFDEATLQALDALIRKKVIDGLGGVIATGKEGNVFYAYTPSDDVVVCKIYKMETSSFHSMSKYIVGDPRFSDIRKNRRSIILNWCKKEYRNLSIAHEVGVRVPLPLAFKDNVLVMEFIGTIGKEEVEASVPLRNMHLTKKQGLYCYDKVVEYVARLFYKGGLIHGDLSEYNILGLVKGKKVEPVIIDIGQGVLEAHPLAQDLINRDVEKLANFFNQFDANITEESVREKIRAWEKRL